MKVFDLKRFRKERNLAQGEIARALNVSQSFLSNVEHGKRPLPASMLDKLCKLYNVENISDYISEIDTSAVNIGDNNKYNIINSPQGLVVPYELAKKMNGEDLAKMLQSKLGANTSTDCVSSLIQLLTASEIRYSEAQKRIKELEAEVAFLKSAVHVKN